MKKPKTKGKGKNCFQLNIMVWPLLALAALFGAGYAEGKTGVVEDGVKTVVEKLA